ncbi:MAG: rfbD [Burkholderiales bacterium]|nr:rfbD [Burkholderiales bacterium]MCE3268704.1 rfbD [Burkholderiales bacterium]
MHIVILGAKGQLGSDLVAICKEKNIFFTPVTQSDFDATRDDLGNKILDKLTNVSHIINCIATTNVDGCESNPDLAFSINASFAYKLSRLCNEKNITLFHISTDYVFDGTKTDLYLETDIPSPQNIYGLSKYTGDMAVMQYAAKYFIFRVSSLFGRAGASGKGGNFITTMQRLGSERDTLSVIANQITSPTATLDVARALVHFITNQINDYGIYNCVSSNSCSWYEFAYAIFKLSGLDEAKLHKADFDSYNFIAKRPKYAVMSTAKISKYYQMPMWQDSLNEYFTKEQ